MANIKKGQLANIIFPMVDGTDFASIESGITASDFNSAATRQYVGYDHGASAAAAFSDLSKATNLVRSGIFHHVLNETETNFDVIMVRFTHPSCADQLLVYYTDTYDDSDIMSRLSDIGSDLLSYLTGLSGMISDVDSQLLLNASMISDVQSALDSQYLVLLSNISDIDSQLNLVATSDYLSQVYSDLASAIGAITASIGASDISDIASAVWANAIGARVDSRILVIQSNVSDVESQLDLTASVVSDIQSALDSQFLIITSDLSDIDSQLNLVATSDYLSQVYSDLASAIGAITVTVSASDMSDIASRVWATTEGARVDSRILVIQSLVSDVDSQLLLNASVVSDVYSLLSDLQSDFQSRVPKAVATNSQVSDLASDLRSYLIGLSGLLSDVDSQLLLNASALSDVQSALDSQYLIILSNISDIDSQLNLVATSNYLSQIASDLYSAIGNVSVALTASDISDIASAVADAISTIGPSDISDIASAVWANAIGARVDSRILVIQSNVSDVESQVDLLATSNYLSQVVSDLSSQIGGITAGVSASDISDIASAVWANTIGARVDSRILVIQSNVSDVDSQLLLNASMISDIQSALDSQYLVILSNLSDVDSQVNLLATSNYLSQVHSDLASAIGAITAGVSASDISDIASAVWADTIGARVDSRVLVLQSNLSDVESQLDVTASMASDIYSLLSDVESQVDLNASVVSDIQSALDSQYAAESNYLSQIYSDLDSAIGAVAVTLTDSDISDIVSGIQAGLSTIDASDISDIASAVWAYTSRTLTAFGSGAISYTYTVTDSVTTNPIDGAEVWITTDLAGTNVIWAGVTDAFGVARDAAGNLPALDAGTYYFWKQIAGYLDDDSPDTEVVS